MGFFKRLMPLTAVAALATNALTGCGGGGQSSLVPGGSGASSTTQSLARSGGLESGLTPSGTAGVAPGSLRPDASVPRMEGPLAYIDAGRKASNEMVNVSLTLRYNHQDELDAFVAAVSDPNSGQYHHYLTPAQFNAYYAPTIEQETAVVNALQSAGFTITQRFDNRTIVDAKAPASTVERFFATEMHSVNQGKYGRRYTNVKEATLPSGIASIVRTVSMNNLIVVQTAVEQAGGVIHPHAGGINVVAKPDSAAQQAASVEGPRKNMITPDACGGQLLLNPGFESGNTAWATTSGVITDDSADAYAGSWFAWLDGYTSAETDTLQQSVAIPSGCTATLTYELYVGTNERSTAGTLDTLALTVNGTTEQTFSNKTTTGGDYVAESVNLSAFAGTTATILWTSKQTGSRATNFFIDQTALTLSGGTSTPTPSPVPTATATAKPTATPTAAPTATASAAPTATPVHTATPTPVPTATPTTAPTATPVPTATPTSGGSTCNNAAPLNGPLTDASNSGTPKGTLSTGVAKPFDFPVQHGCDGLGYTAAIIIDDPMNTTYLNQYLSAAQETYKGTLTNVAVDGGGSGDDAETDLDVETIAGLAPSANIIVYDIGSLGDQEIEDAYNKAITDGKTSAVNSSFGGCESSDTSFESSTNSIAQQGAATGVEFSASSGDTGSNECSGKKGVSAPAGGPYFLSVGGIDFTDTTAGVLQTVTMGVAGSDSGGGGVSTVVAEPSYQQGIAGMLTTGRNQPDISLPFYPVSVYGSQPGVYLGTSWSSPASVAFILEASEMHASKLGWVNPTIYSLFKSTGYNSYFTPCTSGTNGAYTCSATQYNQAAGIGAPKGEALATAL